MSDLAWLIDQVTPPRPAASKPAQAAAPAPTTFVATRRKSQQPKAPTT
jgi:hypothetical protein